MKTSSFVRNSNPSSFVAANWKNSRWYSLLFVILTSFGTFSERAIHTYSKLPSLCVFLPEGRETGDYKGSSMGSQLLSDIYYNDMFSNSKSCKFIEYSFWSSVRVGRQSLTYINSALGVVEGTSFVFKLGNLCHGQRQWKWREREQEGNSKGHIAR